MARDDLLAALDEDDYQVVLLAGPQGSGKTVTLGQWARRQRIPVAWVSLTGPHHGGLGAIWHAILRAISSARTELELPGTADLANAERIVNRLVPELMNTLAEVEKLTLVLDGFGHITDPLARDILGQFLQQLPPQVKVLLSSNRPAEGPILQLRAAGRLKDISAEKLKFSVGETYDLLARTTGQPWHPDAVERLHANLDGWAVGLRLAGLHPHESNARGIADAALSYVRVEVLDKATASQRDALLRTSVLSQLTFDGVVAVTGPDVPRALMSFAESSLFLSRTPDGWNRHPVLHAAAAEHLGRVDPHLQTSLISRSVPWLAAKRDFVAAAEAAMGAGMLAQAAEHVVASWPAGDPERVVQVATRLGQPAPAQVAAVGAAAALACGAPNRALEFLKPFEAAEAASPVRAHLYLQRGDLAGAGAELEKHGRSRDGEAASWDGLLADITRAALDLWRDRPGSAIWRLEQAAARAARVNYTDAHLKALDLLVACAYLTSDGKRADDSAREAIHIYRSSRQRGAAPVIALTYLQAVGGPGATGVQSHLQPERSPGPHQDAFAAYLRATAAARTGDHVRQRLAQMEARSALLPEAAGPLLRSLLEDGGPAEADNAEQCLTDREMVVLRALSGPLTLREIARELHVSHNTIKSQVSSLFRKLGTHDRVGALRVARERGLIPR
ncbi:helix-turn-helix transcriptional regulator [Pimelobacter simplex]|uniref:helix-turn-helix transcriptional regulator n=1 Tax=Nocardioides simplex TaxID=2045 RepID=UPI0019335764|nr:hypothetical protein [Pimelobacter simplex]